VTNSVGLLVLGHITALAWCSLLLQTE